MNPKKEIIITGVHGFVGHHVAREFKDAGYIVHGIGREAEPQPDIREVLDTYSAGNLLDESSLQTISFKGAVAIIHLASLASVAESFKQPDRYINDNRAMTENLLAEALSQGFKGRAVVVSTGAIYDPQQPMPLNEASALAGISPYSIGKIASEEVAMSYRNNGMDVVIARPFNHIGPGQITGFLVPDLWSQIASAHQSHASKIGIGNLSSLRDYTDVRDIAHAYRLLALSPRLHFPVYNICSGNSYSGKDILDRLQSIAGTSLTPTIDPEKFRPSDAPAIIGDSSRIRDELGWIPHITLNTTLQDFISSQPKITT